MSTTTASRDINVLYVDDNSTDRRLVRNARLSAGGFQLTEAASRAEFDIQLA